MEKIPLDSKEGVNTFVYNPNHIPINLEDVLPEAGKIRSNPPKHVYYVNILHMKRKQKSTANNAMTIGMDGDPFLYPSEGPVKSEQASFGNANSDTSANMSWDLFVVVIIGGEGAHSLSVELPKKKRRLTTDLRMKEDKMNINMTTASASGAMPTTTATTATATTTTTTTTTTAMTTMTTTTMSMPTTTATGSSTAMSASTSMSTGTGTSANSEGESFDDFEYYVHYHAFDRRLDEYVSSDQIVFELSLATRVMKAMYQMLPKNMTMTDDMSGVANANDQDAGFQEDMSMTSHDHYSSAFQSVLSSNNKSKLSFFDWLTFGDNQKDDKITAATSTMKDLTICSATERIDIPCSNNGVYQGYNLKDRKQIKLLAEHSMIIKQRDCQWRADNYNDECDFKEEDLRAHQQSTKVKNFSHVVIGWCVCVYIYIYAHICIYMHMHMYVYAYVCICIGKYRVKTWYFSPIPQEYRTATTLYFCDFCLSFFAHLCELHYHMSKCQMTHPPGDEIYRSKEHNCLISVFEVDGALEPMYCQNISYLAKFFLDHKTLQYDTTSFYFYIVTQVSDYGCHFLSYFSKEKNPEKEFNLSCIMTLPCHQRKGLGTFMMSLSYGLSKIEQKLGMFFVCYIYVYTYTSAFLDEYLGLISYRKYWATEILKVIRNKLNRYKHKTRNMSNDDSLTLSTKDEDDENDARLSVGDISKCTGFKQDDIWWTLVDMGVLRRKILKEKESGNTLKEDYVLAVNQDIFDKYLKPKELDPNDIYVGLCKQSLIHWVPHSYSQQNATKK
ncbi:H3/H4 histone acetyltransferase [Reticulomyxa filosa]|uniref:histone acetyltransferase n=1 Tax=Reticulomyxa filosa TaxID=46433 RepID=X6NB85_RETFI|nr:H3/H4 histone acetyltransferase [Reticulomyxa filosa]|eukprot:ETO23024.1 H3/H4 histone acetyltransferase [Reticulomyxa filosa]